MTTIIHGKPASPGERRMTRPHTSADGRVWPTGTLYQLGSSGLDCEHHRLWQIARIDGQQVVFYE